MSQDHQQPKPLDMNEAFRGIAQEVVGANAGVALANALIASGNALRQQAYAMMSNINANELLTPPALMEDGSSLALLPFFRPIPGFFRMIAAYSPSGERTITVFIENEAETLKTGFFNLGDAQRAELNRQLDLLNFKNDGPAAVEFGLMVVEKPVEGYKYFEPEAKPAADVIDAVATDKVVGDTPTLVKADAAPVDLASVIPDATA